MKLWFNKNTDWNKKLIALNEDITKRRIETIRSQIEIIEECNNFITDTRLPTEEEERKEAEFRYLKAKKKLVEFIKGEDNGTTKT